VRRVFFLALLAAAGALADESLNLGGYFEQSADILYSEKIDELILHRSKLRLDFRAGGGEDQLAFRGNLDIQKYFGPTKFPVAYLLPPIALDAWESMGLPEAMPLDAERIWLDNAWIDWNRGDSRLRLGKQQLGWGPGYAFNPTDLFHRKDIVDPDYEKEGVMALRWDRFWGVGGRASVVVAPREELKHYGLALRLAEHVAGADIALSAHAVTDSSDARGIVRFQDRYALGLELSGEISEFGFWLEGNRNWMEKESDFTRLVAGLDYSFAGGGSMLLEGFYNGRTEGGPPYAPAEWTRYLSSGEPVGEGWLMAGWRAVPTPLSELSVFAFRAWDGSLLLSPRLDVWIAQNAMASLIGEAALGEAEGSFPDGLFGLTGRVTVSF